MRVVLCNEIGFFLYERVHNVIGLNVSPLKHPTKNTVHYDI